MKYIDLHQDILCHIKTGQEIGQNKQTSFEWIRQSGATCVVATAFPVPEGEDFFSPLLPNMIEDEFLEYRELCEKSDEWELITSSQELNESINNEKTTGILLHIEGLNVVPEKETLERWYNLGWRSLGIVWILTNPLGGGTNEEGGLTERGKELIKFANNKGMIVDFAHMNQQTFKEAAGVHEGPIYISHSAINSIHPHIRNTTDEQLDLIKERDGVIGLFFAQKYLCEGDEAELGHLVDQFKYVRDRIGIDHVAIGSDFGGVISGMVNDIESCLDMNKLWDALENAGFSPEEVEKIAYKNASRVMKKMLK